jgi:hypothetical protein
MTGETLGARKREGLLFEGLRLFFLAIRRWIRIGLMAMG